MSETVSFRYQSIANMCRLLTTIQFEQSRNPREIAVFHKRFDNEKDKVFEDIFIKLFPQGALIGEAEINKAVDYISEFMLKDEKTKELFVEYDKARYNSYVYFKIDNEVFPAQFGNHAEIVTDLCIDYFKNFEAKDIDKDYIKKFILNNFEIKSNYSTLEMIASNARFIYNQIIFA